MLQYLKSSVHVQFSCYVGWTSGKLWSCQEQPLLKQVCIKFDYVSKPICQNFVWTHIFQIYPGGGGGGGQYPPPPARYAPHVHMKYESPWIYYITQSTLSLSNLLCSQIIAFRRRLGRMFAEWMQQFGHFEIKATIGHFFWPMFNLVISNFQRFHCSATL